MQEPTQFYDFSYSKQETGSSTCGIQVQEVAIGGPFKSEGSRGC